MANKKSGKVEKIDGFSADVRQEKIDALKQLVPEAFSDGKIDVKSLRKLVGEDVVTEEERYRLEWSGKSEMFDEIAERSSCTLTLDEKRSSKDWKDSDNIFIEGENLEVLRTLQKAYNGKVKMIYIDPPYNTGKDFVYNDNFRETEAEYCDDGCNVDENGLLKKAYKLNSKDGGRFHSNWLSMMYPRLYLARNLLKEDGVIFVSIDDNEVHNLRMIMNEIFGEENFISQIIWQKKQSPQNDSTYLSPMHDYIVVFAKKAKQVKTDEIGWKMNLLPRNEEQEGRYKNPDNDLRGDWASVDMTSNKTATQRPNLYFAVTNPYTKQEIFPPKQRVWRYSKVKLTELASDSRIWWGPDGSGFPRQKRYLSEVQDGVVPSTWWDREFAGDNQFAKRELRNLFINGEEVFDTPKPTTLIRRMLQIATEKNDLIMDFFAGSGTTAHAVLLQNAADGGNRRYINIQIPEQVSEGSEAYLAGYKTISDGTITRIKKAQDKIKKEHPEFKGNLGVRVYKETESHFPQWHSQAFKSDEDLEQAMLDYSKAEPTGSAIDKATEVLLKLGYPLTTPVIEKDGYMMADEEVALVLDAKFNVKNLQKVLEASPGTVIVLEKLFKKDEDKINFALRCKEADVIFQTV